MLFPQIPVFLMLLFMGIYSYADAKCSHTEIEHCFTSDMAHPCDCIACKVCPPGYGHEPQCGSKVVSSQDVTPWCKKCILGKTYSSWKDRGSCQPCPICYGKRELKPCTLTQPTICSNECKEGFVMNPITSTCEPDGRDDTNKFDKIKTTTINATDGQDINQTIPNATKTEPTEKSQTETTSPPTDNNSTFEIVVIIVVLLFSILFTVLMWRSIIRNQEVYIVQRILRCFRRDEVTNTTNVSETAPLQTKVPDSLLLNGIQHSMEDAICTRISNNTIGIKNWRDIGHNYGITKHDLDTMELPCMGNKTPGHHLLEKICAIKPRESLKDFMKVLQRMSRNDVLDAIEEEYRQEINDQ